MEARTPRCSTVLRKDDDSGGGLGLGWASGRKGRKGDGLALGPEQGGVLFFNSPLLFSVSKQNSYFDLTENSN
jgi:hypothetical protein